MSFAKFKFSILFPLGLLFASSVLAVHCGGSGDKAAADPVRRDPKPKPDPAAIPEGLWEGSFHSQVSGLTHPALGLVLADGSGGFWVEGAFRLRIPAFAGGKADGRMFAEPMIKLKDGTESGGVSLTATHLAAREILAGKYSGGGDHGTFSLTYRQAYEQPVPMARLAGSWMWSRTRLLSPFHVDLAGDGKFDAENKFGASFSGSLEAREPPARGARIRFAFGQTPADDSVGSAFLLSGSGGSGSELFFVASGPHPDPVHFVAGKFVKH